MSPRTLSIAVAAIALFTAAGVWFYLADSSTPDERLQERIREIGGGR